MKTRYLFFLLVCFCLAASSCFSPLDYKGSEVNGESAIKISFPGAVPSGKGALVDPDALLYKLTLKGGDADDIAITAKHGETVFVPVTPGEWYILVEAFKNESTGIMQAIGEYAVTVNAGKTADAPITMAVYTAVYNALELKAAMECAEPHNEFVVINGSFDFTADNFKVPAGKKVSIVAAGDSEIHFPASNPAINVMGKAELVLGPAYPESKFQGEITLNGDSLANIAIHVDSDSLFTMNSGKITGFDRGVYNYLGTFNMNGGSIEDNDTFGVQNLKTFNMNGGTITGNNYAVENSGTFFMNSGNITENEGGVLNYKTFTMNSGIISLNGLVNQGGGVYNDTESTFYMNGGIIEKNEAQHGAGVRNCGTFIMNNGSIEFNNAVGTGQGGGVFNDLNASFTMNGGSISNNDAYFGGGGVYNNYDSAFTMNSGTIGNNSSDGVRNYGTFTMNGNAAIISNTGGGVENNKTFTMNGGIIEKNNSPQGLFRPQGGGVYNVGSWDPGAEEECTTFIMNGGTITENHANQGGGVYNGFFPDVIEDIPAVLTINGGTISNNYAADGGGVYNEGKFTMSGGSISNNTAEKGAGIYNKPIDIFEDPAFTMSGNASITGNVALYDGGGVYNDSNTMFEMKGGYIKENKAGWDSGSNGTSEYGGNGGGVYNYYYFVTFDMSGGEISGNTAYAETDHWENGLGGGVYNTADFTMSSGTITKNTAFAGGGAYNGAIESAPVFVMSGNAGIVENVAFSEGGGVFNGSGVEFTMEGGKISKNKAGWDSDNNKPAEWGGYGGGVYCEWDADFTMLDGEISGNTAYMYVHEVEGESVSYGGDGGGVFHNGYTFSFESGIITGNTAQNYGGGVFIMDDEFVHNYPRELIKDNFAKFPEEEGTGDVNVYGWST